MNLQSIPYSALGFALLLSLHGLRKKSLSPSGAYMAFIVGVGTMAGGIRAFGVSLIGFYLLGSRATKYGKHRKIKYEEGYQEAGYRTGWQVLCNSFGAVIAAVVWNILYAPISIQAQVLGGLVPLKGGERIYAPDAWCAAERGSWSRALLFAALGHFGCCLGDTLASELGILSGSEPRLITTMKVVPRGTNGGMSVDGTVWSVVGGAVMGIIMGACLLWENKACEITILTGMVGWGAFAGGFGSLVDSFLGATVQRTRYSADRRVILQDESRGDERDIKVISGWNILSNNQVNLLSSLVTAGVLMIFA